MRDAATVLGIIQDRGRRGLPLEDVSRQLSNPALYLLAYGTIAGNAGALTPGATAETMAARQRKTLVVCQAFHAAIHAGRPPRTVHHHAESWRAGCR